MAGYSKRFDVRVNISKPYKDIPLHIILYFKKEKSILSIERIGEELNLFFKVPVYYGNATKGKNTSYDYIFDPKKVFKRIDLSGLLKTKLSDAPTKTYSDTPEKMQEHPDILFSCGPSSDDVLKPEKILPGLMVATAEEMLGLISDLKIAEKELSKYSGGYSAEFFGAEEFHSALEDSIAKLESGDRQIIDKLWLWFAPTCQWDDFVGNAELGNKIFERLDKIRNSL